MELKPGARVGLWTLAERLGRGGMAEVWRGSADDSPDVAIKLMPHARPGATFDAEAAALARLVHPRIIRILDFGSVELEEVELPFLALELAQGPALDHWLQQTEIGWREVLDVARRMLEALAHAHSRGLVHRDIKPANVLAMDAAGRDWRVTDFGIARTDALIADDNNPSGTPPYMAPEQFIGRGRDQGPWTDLYAFGCVLYEMVCGKPPYGSRPPMQLAFAHLREPVPELEPRMEVPDGLAAYLNVLLRKEPLSRFRHAADALRALEKLPPLRRSHAVAVLPMEPSMQTYVTPAFEPTLLLGDLTAFEWTPALEGEAPTIESPPPPATPPATSARHYFQTFHGDTGPGLMGLRELPFVGRVDERTRVWDAFRRVVANRRREVFGIWGPPGIGKSALGRWLTQTVAEHGLAHEVRVDAPTDPQTAMLAAVSSAYRLTGLDEAAAAERIRRWADAPAWAVEGVARAVAGTAGPDEDVVGAAQAIFWAHAERQPLVVWIDAPAHDAGWSALIERVARVPYTDVPVLVLTATRMVTASVARLLDDELELGPFAPGECADLIMELLGIAAGEAFRIAQVVEGNPQLAVEVVTDWVGKGHLLRRAGHWRLRGGALPPLPPSVGAVRLRQVDAAVGENADDRQALVVLACFGPRAPRGEWQNASALLGIDPSNSLLSRCLRAGILTQDGDAVTFTDGVLRRGLLAAVDAEERRRCHRAIAAVVREHPERHPPAVVGAQLVAAGELTEAAAFLRVGLRDMTDFTSEDAAELLDMYEVAIASAPEPDAEAVAWARFFRGRFESARRHSDVAHGAFLDAMGAAAAHGWTELELRATLAFVTYFSARSPSRAQGSIATRGVALAERMGTASWRAQARNAAGAMFGYLGQLDRALALYEEAREIAAAAGDIGELADAEYGIGWVYFLQGKPAQALEPLRRAMDAMVGLGRVSASYGVRSFMGDVYRALGRLDEADEAFTAAYRYLSRYHVLDAVIPINFAVLEVARGRVDDALRWARRAREIERERDRKAILAIADAVELLAAARIGDADAWDRFQAELQLRVSADSANYDLAYVVDVAAREAAGGLGGARAQAAIELGVALWMRLGRAEEADALRAL